MILIEFLGRRVLALAARVLYVLELGHMVRPSRSCYCGPRLNPVHIWTNKHKEKTRYEEAYIVFLAGLSGSWYFRDSGGRPEVARRANGPAVSDLPAGLPRPLTKKGPAFS